MNTILVIPCGNPISLKDKAFSIFSEFLPQKFSIFLNGISMHKISANSYNTIRLVSSTAHPQSVGKSETFSVLLVLSVPASGFQNPYQIRIIAGFRLVILQRGDDYNTHHALSYPQPVPALLPTNRRILPGGLKNSPPKSKVRFLVHYNRHADCPHRIMYIHSSHNSF